MNEQQQGESLHSHTDFLFLAIPRPSSPLALQHTTTSICSSLKRNSKPPPMYALAEVLLAAPLLLAIATSAQTVTLIESLPFSTEGFASDADPAVFTLIPLEVSELLGRKAGGRATSLAA